MQLNYTRYEWKLYFMGCYLCKTPLHLQEASSTLWVVNVRRNGGNQRGWPSSYSVGIADRELQEGFKVRRFQEKQIRTNESNQENGQLTPWSIGLPRDAFLGGTSSQKNFFL